MNHPVHTYTVGTRLVHCCVIHQATRAKFFLWKLQEVDDVRPQRTLNATVIIVRYIFQILTRVFTVIILLHIFSFYTTRADHDRGTPRTPRTLVE